MFGHILRCSENTPAQLALFFAVESEENELFRGRWGRPRLNLFNVLVSDLGKRNLSIDSVDELYETMRFGILRSARGVGPICMGTDYSFNVFLLTILTI